MSTHDGCVILATNESKGSCLKICTPQAGFDDKEEQILSVDAHSNDANRHEIRTTCMQKLDPDGASMVSGHEEHITPRPGKPGKSTRHGMIYAWKVVKRKGECRCDLVQVSKLSIRSEHLRHQTKNRRLARPLPLESRAGVKMYHHER